MSTNDVLNQYRNSVVDARQYVSDAFKQNPDGTYVYDEAHRGFIIDAAIMKFFIAWETFLESIFKCYLLGERTTDGTLVATQVIARNEQHAGKLLVGINKYFDWANPEYVCSLSKLYLEENNPIDCSLKSIFSDLRDLRTIRNAAAHMTETTKKPLEGLAQRKTGRMQVGIKPYAFVLMIESGTKTYWDYYQQILDIAAENIAKGIIL